MLNQKTFDNGCKLKKVRLCKEVLDNKLKSKKKRKIFSLCKLKIKKKQDIFLRCKLKIENQEIFFHRKLPHSVPKGKGKIKKRKYSSTVNYRTLCQRAREK
jgi:hypothetical protein